MFWRNCIIFKNKKKIVLKDIIEFDKSKIKWKSAYPDELGRVLCLVDPYWCRMYKLDIKIEVPVTIQKSVVKEGCSNDQREYYLDTEFQIMNEAQFFKRRMVFHLKDWKYNEVEAVNNFNKRIMKLKDYYRAANETAKNYLIPSDHLISLRGKYNNVKKKIYKEWNDLFIKHCQNEKSKSITLTDLYNDLKVEDKSNVINFSSKP